MVDRTGTGHGGGGLDGGMCHGLDRDRDNMCVCCAATKHGLPLLHPTTPRPACHPPPPACGGWCGFGTWLGSCTACPMAFFHFVVAGTPSHCILPVLQTSPAPSHLPAQGRVNRTCMADGFGERFSSLSVVYVMYACTDYYSPHPFPPFHALPTTLIACIPIPFHCTWRDGRVAPGSGIGKL